MRNFWGMGRRRVIKKRKAHHHLRRKSWKRGGVKRSQRRLNILKAMTQRIQMLFHSLIRKDGFQSGRELNIGKSMGIWAFVGRREVSQMPMFVSYKKFSVYVMQLI